MKLTPIIKDKRGDVFQIFVILIICLVVAISGLLFLVMTNEVLDTWDNVALLENNTIATETIDVIEDVAPKTTDYAVLFVFLGLNIGVIISAVRTRFSPTLIFLFILMTFISILIAAGMVNMYQGMAHTDAAIESAEQLTFANLIFSKYTPLIMCIISALVLIIMYGKSGADIVT